MQQYDHICKTISIHENRGEGMPLILYSVQTDYSYICLKSECIQSNGVKITVRSIQPVFPDVHFVFEIFQDHSPLHYTKGVVGIHLS